MGLSSAGRASATGRAAAPAAAVWRTRAGGASALFRLSSLSFAVKHLFERSRRVLQPKYVHRPCARCAKSTAQPCVRDATSSSAFFLVTPLVYILWRCAHCLPCRANLAPRALCGSSRGVQTKFSLWLDRTYFCCSSNSSCYAYKFVGLIHRSQARLLPPS